MLQRIQTIYLLLAIIADALMFILPYARITVTESIEFSTSGLIFEEKNLSTIPFALVSGVLVAFTLIALLLYKNRVLQLRLGRLNYILHLFTIVAIFFSVDQMLTKIPNGEVALVEYGIGFYLPVAALAFLFLANRSIKKDEELVRSLDRLRK